MAKRGHCNVDFFKTWTIKSAYILGLLAADGCVTDKNVISFASIDKEQTKRIKDFLEIKKKIYVKPAKDNRKQSYHINIMSILMAKDLARLGIVPRKSLTLEWIGYPEHLESHFLRGFLDGDGHIGMNSKKKKWRIEFYGPRSFLESVVVCISKHLSIDPKHAHLWEKKDQKISTLKYYRLKDVKQIINWIYQDTDSSIRLSRKYKTACKILKVQYERDYPGSGVLKKGNEWIVYIKGIRVARATTKKDAIAAKKYYLETGKKSGLSTIYLEYNGKQCSLREIYDLEPRSITYISFWRRIQEGKSIDEALQSGRKTYSYMGETKLAKDWFRDSRCEVSFQELCERLREGVSIEIAMKALRPAPRQFGKDVPYTIYGESKTLMKWAIDSRCQVSYGTLCRRIREGMNPELALKAQRKPPTKRK